MMAPASGHVDATNPSAGVVALHVGIALSNPPLALLQRGFAVRRGGARSRCRR